MTPLATYRLQLHPGFDFDAAAGVVGYLAELGVSTVFVSTPDLSGPESVLELAGLNA